MSEPGSLEREVKDNMVEDSIEHAKEAIALDVSDGYCWCKTLKFLQNLK